jgi:hypothetical protein
MNSKRILVAGWLLFAVVSLGCSSTGSGGRDGGAAGDAKPDVCTDRNPAGSSANGKACCFGSDCGSGFCADGVCCDSACTGTCMSCNNLDSPGTCKPVPAGLVARRGECAVTDAKTCGLDGMCDGMAACEKYPAMTECDPGMCDGDGLSGRKVCDGMGVCGPGPATSCQPYTCKNNQCLKDTCATDADCAAGVTCTGGQCGTTLPNGPKCTSDARCATGHCVDGVCCNEACDGICVSCNQKNAIGECLPLGAGQLDDKCPRSDVATCGLSGACDGFGMCDNYKSGTPCIPGSCSGTTETTSGTCDGNGTCRPPQQVECDPFMCGATACLDTCTSDAQCVPPARCGTDGRCGKAPMGGSCTSSDQCQAAPDGKQYCAQGVCCNGPCTGQCQSCALPSSPGQCTNVDPGAPDPQGICKDMGATSCKTNGLCDANAGCQLYGSTTVCAPETCSAGAYTGASMCTGSGSGQCLPPKSRSCNPYVCNGSKCWDSCTSSGTQCVAGPSACDVNHTCGPKPPGAPCNQPSECRPAPDGKQYCAQGVCCTTPCSGSCQACNLTGDGTCESVQDGTRDPQAKCVTSNQSSCGTTGKCTKGTCEFYSSASQCRAPSCSSATEALPAYCDGKGDPCPAAKSQDCGAYTCDSGTGLCKTKCSADSDCTGGKFCTNGSCGPKPLGVACSNNSQCQSGACVQGVCCNNSCTGTCMSCLVQNHVGTCTNVPLGGNDPGNRCTKTATTSCGTSGTCDGGGKCDDWDTSTSCRAQTCTSGVQTNAATCDGNGTCSASSTKSCGNYACNGASCKTTCSSSSDCAAGVTCITVLNTCGMPLGNGLKCGVDADCNSGNCVGGVCCSTTCPADSASKPSCYTGQCVAVGQPGAGSCAIKTSGPCGAPASCTNGKQTIASACNASGVCVAPSPMSCSVMTPCTNASTCVGAICSPVTNITGPCSCASGTGTCLNGSCNCVAASGGASGSGGAGSGGITGMGGAASGGSGAGGKLGTGGAGTGGAGGKLGTGGAGTGGAGGKPGTGGAGTGGAGGMPGTGGAGTGGAGGKLGTGGAGTGGEGTGGAGTGGAGTGGAGTGGAGTGGAGTGGAGTGGAGTGGAETGGSGTGGAETGGSGTGGSEAGDASATAMPPSGFRIRTLEPAGSSSRSAASFGELGASDHAG